MTGSGVRFRRDSPEESCAKVIESHEVCGDYQSDDTLACLRTAGHDGECIASMGAAAKADGVCPWCRAKDGAAHCNDCQEVER